MHIKIITKRFKTDVVECIDSGGSEVRASEEAMPLCAATDAPSIGRYRALYCSLSRRVASLIHRQIIDATWPIQKRENVPGHGACLGVTFDRRGAYISPLTKSHEKLIRDINFSISTFLGHLGFRWGSLQINVNTVSKRHMDSNNLGPSCLLLLGKFDKGAFRCVDGSYDVVNPRTAMIIDGHLPHWSEEFAASRVSIVAFCHKGTCDLSADQLDYLRSLGCLLYTSPSPRD